MLKIKGIKNLLEKGRFKGVVSIFLSNTDGSILSKAGADNDKSIHTIAAVIANICNEFYEFGAEILKEEEVNYVFVSCENAYIIARPVYQMILCAQCDLDLNHGLVRKELDALAQVLQEQLKGFQSAIKE